MNIEVAYFGMLTDETGCQAEMVQTSYARVQELNLFLQSKYMGLKKFNYRIAVNDKFVQNDHQFQEGDKISFLPPFAGG